MAIVLRRNASGTTQRIENGANVAPPVVRHTSVHESPLQRLEAATERIISTIDKPFAMKDQPRPEQHEVCVAFAGAMANLVSTMESTTKPDTMMRVIAPPRIGKSYIMAAFVALSGGSALVLAPTLDLVQQLHDEFVAQIPGIKTGIYTGIEKNPQKNGVTFATYQIAYRHWFDCELPEDFRNVTFVFADEAHHAMTTQKMAFFHDAFCKETIRVAFTATEEYTEDKSLKLFFPHLIREITLADAVALGRLANADAYVYEVDVDGSAIDLQGGDYSAGELAAVMEQLPMLEACRVLRYKTDTNANIPATVMCRTKHHAREVQQYLNANRPAGSPPVELMVQDTLPADRLRIRQGFDNGTVDTIVQVHLLREGWNVPRLKLLIDAAPSASGVASTQKYFRPMTPYQGQTAKIYTILPKDLVRFPVLPGEVMNTAVQYKGLPDVWLDAEHRQGGKVTKARCVTREEISAKVTARNVALQGATKKNYGFKGQVPLSLKHIDVVREVVKTLMPNPEQSVVGLGTFGNAMFSTPFFCGTGHRLLRMLGVKQMPKPYGRLLYRLFPGPAAYEYCQRHDIIIVDAPVAWDVELALHFDPSLSQYDRPKVCQEFGEMCSLMMKMETSPCDEEVIHQQELSRMHKARQNVLSERQRFVLERRYEEQLTLSEVGKEMYLARERVRQIEREALLRLRNHSGIRDLRGEPLPEPGEA